MRANLIIAAMVLSLLASHAGQLDDLEEKSEKKKKSSSTSSSKSTSSTSSSSSSFGSGTYPSSSIGDSFLGGFWSWMVASPFRYQHDDPASSSLSGEDIEDEGWGDSPVGMHRIGSMATPYVRADYNWQYINSDLDAQDLRLEAGYKILAFHARHTRYTESNPSDELTVNQYFGVLRIGGPLFEEQSTRSVVELGIGLGVVQHIGNEETSSGALTIPIKYYPWETIGFEFRPAWYVWKDRNIGDYDVSASLGWKYIHVRGGYRWMWMQGQGHLLNGPYAGVSISF